MAHLVCALVTVCYEGRASDAVYELIDLAKISGFSSKVQEYIQQSIEGIHNSTSVLIYCDNWCSSDEEEVMFFVRPFLCQITQNIVNRAHSFPLAPEFWAEPQNFFYVAEFWYFHRILQKLKIHPRLVRFLPWWRIFVTKTELHGTVVNKRNTAWQIALWKRKKYIYFSLYIVSITQHNVTSPAGPLETKVLEQDRAQFTYKWKVAVNRGIWMIFCCGKPWNFANWRA